MLNYSIKDVNATENNYDGSLVCSGNLYHGNTFIGKFYEHPIEGGFYPTGQVADDEIFEDLDAFDNIVTSLVSAYLTQSLMDEQYQEALAEDYARFMWDEYQEECCYKSDMHEYQSYDEHLAEIKRSATKYADEFIADLPF